jgi:hypothetical protein
MISRVETGFNLNWIIANPELFGEAVAKTLVDYPPDHWNVRIAPAYMPGEKYLIICTPKGTVS